MKKNRWVVGLLVFWASSLVVMSNSFAQGGPGRGKGQPPGGMGGELPMHLMQKLNLTDAQKEKLDKLRRKGQREMIRYQSQLQLLQLDLEDLMDQDTVSEKKVYAKVKAIGDLRTKLMLSRTKMMLAMRKILTKQQLKKMKKFLKGKRHSSGKHKRKKGQKPPHKK